MITFEKLDDVSAWKAETLETRYCPFTSRRYKVTKRVWPALHLDSPFTLYVN